MKSVNLFHSTSTTDDEQVMSLEQLGKFMRTITEMRGNVV